MYYHEQPCHAHLVIHERFEAADTLVLDSPEDGVLALVVPHRAGAEDLEENVQPLVLTEFLHPAGMGMGCGECDGYSEWNMGM